MSLLQETVALIKHLGQSTEDIKKGRDPLRTFMPGTARRAP